MSSAPSSRPAGTRAWRSLGTRLAVWYVAVTLASFLALAVVLSLSMHAWAERDGQSSTQSLLERYRSVLETGGTDALRAMFSCDDGPKPSVAIRLRDERNIEVYSASSDEASSRVAAALGEDRRESITPSRAPEGWHFAAASVSQGRQLEVVVRDDSVSRFWAHARELALVVLASGLLSAILGAFVITRRSLRPVGDLARATQAIIDSGDLALRVQSRGAADDLDQLASLFNRMLARNEALVTAMRESLDNVAHDLRTPLTRLRAGAELALRAPEDAARTREALAEAIEESDRVLGMMTTLMDITEAETGAMRLDKHVEDLGAIAREAIDLYDMVSGERGVHIVTRLRPAFASASTARASGRFAPTSSTTPSSTRPPEGASRSRSRLTRRRPSSPSSIPALASRPPIGLGYGIVFIAAIRAARSVGSGSGSRSSRPSSKRTGVRSCFEARSASGRPWRFA